MRICRLFSAGKQIFLLFLSICVQIVIHAQVTFPVNGVADLKSGSYAFTNATIVKDIYTTLTNATLLIREGKIVAVGTALSIPSDAVIIDCSSKYIYPSFIDLYTDYGISTPPPSGVAAGRSSQGDQFQKGAFGWNQAIRSDVDALTLFVTDESKAKTLRDIGFGTVLTHMKDGIARGTGAAVTLSNEKENLAMVKEKASANYSLNKGSSTQNYPSSLMGSIALLRQTYIDAQWYKSNPAKEGVNITLTAWQNNQALPQIFDAGSKWNDIRADRIGDEFGVQFIIKGGGDEYQRIKEIAATKASYILPLNFPAAMEVDDPNEVRFIGLDDLKHWELAPTNPAAFEKAGIPFALTTADLSSVNEFTANLRKAIEYGLTETKALEALTKTPAELLGIYSKTGSIEAGKLANFLIMSGPIFNDKTVLLNNWVHGIKYSIKEENWYNVKGKYQLKLNISSAPKILSLELKDNGVALFIEKDTLTGKYTYNGKLVKLSYSVGSGIEAQETILSGIANGNTWNGSGNDSTGDMFTWTATLQKSAIAKADTIKPKEPLILGKVTYPFLAYGFEEMPKQETILIRNATVWTNEKEGIKVGIDVLVKNGKIAAIGKNLSAAGARNIDGTGKHLTPGIVDEHSHIAVSSINEGGQSVTSEVRISDNLNPDDINIYRQLSGGVTTSHILHGSANTIGGQTQLIKLRWGGNDEDLKFKGSAPFIKFALGENVKRSSSSQGNSRFPDTRMGVEQVLADAFQRATDYKKSLKLAEENNRKKGATPVIFRHDLELDALVEIMDKKRFITCHSYVQSEITSTMRALEKYGVQVNTFTHILEGYKVADKLKAHGANVSTFSDWWQYKMEVLDAIPYNATLMQRVGLNVAINSDDAEMARRLNQESAKSIKYGGMSEEDALKMCSINPAKMMHVDDKIGSIKVGKDADLVLWSHNPLSIYAVAETTIVDGIIYFDRASDMAMREEIKAEKIRLLQKMAAVKKGTGTQPKIQKAKPRFEVIMTCDEHAHKHGLLTIEDDGDYNNNNE